MRLGPGCGRGHYARGRCQAHYMRFRRTGFDNRVMTGRPGVWRWIDHIQDTPGPFNSGGGS